MNCERLYGVAVIDGRQVQVNAVFFSESQGLASDKWWRGSNLGWIKGGAVRKYKWMPFPQSHFTGRPIQFVRGVAQWDGQPGEGKRLHGQVKSSQFRYTCNQIDQRTSRKEEQQPLFYWNRTVIYTVKWSLISFLPAGSCQSVLTFPAETGWALSVSESSLRWPCSLCSLWVRPHAVVFPLLWTPPTSSSGFHCLTLSAALFYCL